MSEERHAIKTERYHVSLRHKRSAWHSHMISSTADTITLFSAVVTNPPTNSIPQGLRHNGREQRHRVCRARYHAYVQSRPLVTPHSANRAGEVIPMFRASKWTIGSGKRRTRGLDRSYSCRGTIRDGRPRERRDDDHAEPAGRRRRRRRG